MKPVNFNKVTLKIIVIHVSNDLFMQFFLLPDGAIVKATSSFRKEMEVDGYLKLLLVTSNKLPKQFSDKKGKIDLTRMRYVCKAIQKKLGVKKDQDVASGPYTKSIYVTKTRNSG